MTYKSKFVTFVLSWVPGLGHLYLGLNKRGLQFMIAAFACIAFTGVIPMVFPFIFAIIWFYALFDALQKASAINLYVAQRENDNQFNQQWEQEAAVHSDLSHLDEQLVSFDSLSRNRNTGPLWLGGLSILMGLLVLLRQMAPQIWYELVRVNMGALLLALVLIGFGIWLIRSQLQHRSQNDAGKDEKAE